jgi:hypothetical protein
MGTLGALSLISNGLVEAKKMSFAPDGARTEASAAPTSAQSSWSERAVSCRAARTNRSMRGADMSPRDPSGFKS